ncbi:MAG: hypothetical protein RL459_1095 [Pseudomonadota bacterium]
MACMQVSQGDTASMSNNPAMPMSHAPVSRRNLPLLLLQVRELVMARFRPMLNEAGVTEQQWRVLRALLSEGSLEPRQIGEFCCLSSASLVGILGRMEDLGLVKRQRLEGDQRRVLVSPSAKSQQLAEKLAPQIDLIYTQLEADMGSDIAEQLYSTLDAIQGRLSGCSSTTPEPDPGSAP